MNVHQNKAMSLAVKPSRVHTPRLSTNNGGLRFDPSLQGVKSTERFASPSVETPDTSTRLRFTNLTLKELSEELHLRTKETQRLQEEVENATQVALQRFGCDSSLGQSSHSHGLAASFQQGQTHPLVVGVDNLNQKSCQSSGSPSMVTIENAIDDCLQRLSRRHINKGENGSGQETSTLQEACMDLQVQLQSVQMENDFLSDLRVMESNKHVEQMEKMLSILEELLIIFRSADQKALKAENEAKNLSRREETQETIKDHTLCGTHQRHSQFICAENASGSKLPSAVGHRSRDFNKETENTRKQHFVTEERTTVDEYNKENQQGRIEELFTYLSHEMATLTEKLSSSKDCGTALNVKLQLLKTLSDRQTLLHERHISDLESTLIDHKDKVCSVENQLAEVNTELYNVQRENNQSQQQSKELQLKLNQIQSFCEEQKCEHLVIVKSLKGQLESTREQLHNTEEKLSLLEQRAQSQELQKCKDKELRFAQQEAQQYRARLEEIQDHFQTLLAEQKASSLKLNEKEQTIVVLRLQTENSIQMTEQLKRTIDSLNQENSLLSNQLNQCKMEIQHLRVESDKHKSGMAAAAFEKQKLQASVVEQSDHAREQSLEKQQLNAQLELQRVQLHTVTEEHKELQKLFSCKQEEYKGVVLKLQSELSNTHDELDQIRGLLRTLEGASRRGLRVAQDLQSEVTARRDQVDSMQSRIQHLEASVAKHRQEKHDQNLDTQRQIQKLSLVREDRKRLTIELEALHSKDQQLKECTTELKTILQKMSESFANCQDFIHLRKQEFFSLKERQSPNLHTALNDSLTSSSLTSLVSSKQLPSSQIKTAHSQRQQNNSTHELRSPVRDMRGVASSKNCGPHTSTSSGAHRRRSLPERARRITFAEEANTDSKIGRKTRGSELQIPKTSEPRKKTAHSSLPKSRAEYGSPVKDISSLQPLSPGRRSPVYSLLTSNPAK